MSPRPKPAASPSAPPAAAPSLGELGLSRFAPYLMNRIMGRYNAELRGELARLGLSTPKMRALAVLSVRDGLTINELAVYGRLRAIDDEPHAGPARGGEPRAARG